MNENIIFTHHSSHWFLCVIEFRKIKTQPWVDRKTKRIMSIGGWRLGTMLRQKKINL